MPFEHAADAPTERSSDDRGLPRVLLLDNYDSYTWNLFQQLARVAGSEPLVARNDELTAAALTAMELDAIVISPGPGHPGRHRDFGICRHAFSLHVPVLGVCLGHQGLALAHGGSVGLSDAPVHGRTSPILHDGTGLFEGIPGGFSAVRYHSLEVLHPLPACLEVIASTPTGVVMALRHRERPQWGVQFHPESIGTEHGDRLIDNFLRLARAAAAPRRTPPSLHGATAPPSARHGGASRPEPVRSVVAGRGDLHHRRLGGWVDPEQVFVHLYGREPCAFWLDSARTDGASARWSYMGAADQTEDHVVRYHATSRELVIEHQGQASRRHESVLAWLERELAPAPRERALPGPFQGGLVGYLGYGLAAELGGPTSSPSPWPDATLMTCRRWLAFDHEERALYAIAQHEDPEQARRWLARVAERLAGLPPAPPVEHEGCTGPVTFRLARDRQGYLADIARCLAEIRRGETYEVCLTNQLLGPPLARPLDAYRILRARNPAPFGAYLRLPELAVLSCSPELFLRVDAAGRVVTKPIKGTQRRGSTPAEDDQLRRQLATSEKDRAENLMIVDLLRNDLGRVCAVGSVEVPALMRVESFATVHQLVSTVEGRLRPGASALDCLRAAFPGGSMTGAPKLRTLEIIDALEPRPRGIYSGCLGWLSTDGAAELAMTIRTVVADAEGTSVGVGGAIVALSDPEAELEEIELKGRVLVEGIAAAKTGRSEAWDVSTLVP